MKNTVLFTLRVWLTGVAAILIIMWITDLIIPDQAENNFLDEVVWRTFSILSLSAIYAIAFLLSVLLVKMLGLNILLSKLILMIITFFISWLPIMILKIVLEDLDTISFGYKLEVFLYVVINCVCIGFYKLETISAKVIESEN